MLFPPKLSSARSVPLLTYGNGDVLNAHKTKAIFWGSQWNSASFAGDKIAGIDQFFSNFNGSQYGSTSNRATAPTAPVRGTRSLHGLVDPHAPASVHSLSMAQRKWP